MHSVIPLDLNFLDRKNAIAVFLIPYIGGAVLIETGPGSTIGELTNALKQNGFRPGDITHIFITHIHLDHAGAAGWFAQNGAQIFVHPAGEAHMKNPDKLLSSASRIYGEKMDFLWGDFLPVPSDKLSTIHDLEQVTIGDLTITAIHTPGHAHHHISWLVEETCFTGDVGGVRIPGFSHIRLPLVPPELHIGKWKESLVRLEELNIRNVAPTHFGIFNDAKKHFKQARTLLDEIEEWMDNVINEETNIESLRALYLSFLSDQGTKSGVGDEVLQLYEIANPSWMGADGLFRYWNKFAEKRK